MMPLCLLLLSSLASAHVSFDGKAFYLGDLHAHTGISRDGGSADLENCRGECGAFSDVMDIARENGLDFVSLTEHVNGLQSCDARGFAMALQTQLAVDEEAGGLVVLPGAELWWQIDDNGMGHKNLYFRGSDEELAALTLEDVRPNGEDERIEDCAAIWDFLELVEARWGSVLLLPHHTAMSGGMGTDWSCHTDPRAAHFAPAVEIYSRHGDSEECEPEFDPVWQLCDPAKTVEAALDPDGKGLRLGFVGGTDEHDTQPGAVCRRETQMIQHPYGGGLTVTVLEDGATFDRGSLFDAIVAHSTYTTSGPLLPVVVAYRAGGVEIGGLGVELEVPEGEDLEVEVRVPSEHSDVVKNVFLRAPNMETTLTSQGGGRYLGRLAASDRPVWVYVRLQLDGEVWYGDDGCDDGGDDLQEYIWLSPSWLSLPEPDTGVADDTGTRDTGARPDDSADSGGDSAVADDTQSPSWPEGECHCECTCEERGCGLLGVSGLFALALTAFPLLAGRRRPRA